MRGTPIPLIAADIATAMRGTLASGLPDTEIGGFSLDSRTLRAGDLFFAIVAARDGHDYVTAALERGAVGAVISHPIGRAVRSGPKAPVIVEVADTTGALQDLARHVRREAGIPVIAITGSAGKTTTKETIAEFLSGRYRVIRNKGNLNNQLGLPLSLLELRHGADVAVMELGMNHAGEIRVLVDIAEPDVRVWTNVGDAHLGYFESREAIADAKAEILEGAGADDLLVCNADDPLVMGRSAGFGGRRVTFGTGRAADVRAERVEDLGLDGVRFTLATPRGSTVVQSPLLGGGNLMNVLAAAAVAVEFDVPVEEIAARSAALQPARHRGAVVRLRGGITIVDDSYNSSPAALQQALDVLVRETRLRRKAAVLGEMLELGDHSLELHEQCGRLAAEAGLERLIAVGGDAAQALCRAAIHAGMAEDAATWTASSAAAADVILPWLRDGDLVLVKGSRGINTDVVVDRLVEELS